MVQGKSATDNENITYSQCVFNIPVAVVYPMSFTFKKSYQLCFFFDLLCTPCYQQREVNSFREPENMGASKIYGLNL